CASETAGGSAASARNAATSTAGSCGARRRSTRGASGAGPSRKNRSPSPSNRSASHAAASFARRYSASRRASSSAASSGSSSSSSTRGKLTLRPDAALRDRHRRPLWHAPPRRPPGLRLAAPDELPPDEERRRGYEDHDRDPGVQAEAGEFVGRVDPQELL